ncbi:MAG: sigma-54-dependent Fis family transcriptional regulator [Candidatus Latescibacterota bacterium]|nr:MAG: sigma-54-dependent Fis family transcriptional regulator [Candidatus Latescibacterota bacterium]
MSHRILIVDDEESIRSSLQRLLEYKGYETLSAEDGPRALQLLAEEPVDVVLLDIKMPRMDGIEVLQRIRETYADLSVVMISAHGTIETAVECTKHGAFDFLEKPWDQDRLLLTIRNAITQRQLVREKLELQRTHPGHDEMIGKSAALQDIRDTIERVAQTDARLLIVGENGTGKELVARAVHDKSRRAGMTFVEVNCAAIPEELIESELFGHVKGSFTGAIANRTGKFEQADAGTLFLDEIGDMSLAAQAKVLRVLQEGKLEKVGGNETRLVDVRVIAATNKDLLEEARRGQFREDLYYRLNVVPIHVPPLRERRDDIPLLVDYFLERVAESLGQRPKAIAPDAREILRRQDWPGNVRELRNVVERMVILSRGGQIEPHEVPLDRSAVPRSTRDDIMGHATFQAFKEDAERRFLMRKLAENDGNVSKTARVLEMQRSNLYKKIEKYGLDTRSASD